MKYILPPKRVISKMLTAIVQIKDVNGTAKICDFLNDINYNRSTKKSDERE